MTEPTAYPLAWPIGWPRTSGHLRRTPLFRSSKLNRDNVSEAIPFPAARQRLSDQLDRLGASRPVLSTNMELRLDGQPRADRAAPADPGIACYFLLKGKPIVLACDRWVTVAGNVAAVAAHIDAMRGMDRWGVGSLEQMFTGFAALPAPDNWRSVLGNQPGLDDAEAAYRALARKAHPDAGGSSDAMASLNLAIRAARSEFVRLKEKTGR